MKYYYNYIFCYNVIYSCDLKLNFQHNYSILQGHMIFRNQSYAELLLKKHFFLLLK